MMKSTGRGREDKIALFIWIAIFFICKVFLNIIVINENYMMTSIGLAVIQLQGIILVCLVIFTKKRGYIISVILALYTVVFDALYIIFKAESVIFVMNMIILVGITIINTIIYSYMRRMTLHLDQIREQKQELDRLVNRDTLTGVWNRRSFIGRLESLIMGGTQSTFSVVFIDIDNFKNINDILGHEYGDVMLIQIANSWQKIIDPSDHLARLGGDEFGIIIHRELSNEEILEYINKFKEVIVSNRFNLRTQFNITASFGISCYPKDAKDSAQLIKFADAAMYSAKAHGKNQIEFFSKEMYDKMIRKMEIENGLDHAIQKGEFHIVYQPQYTCKNKELRGFEVLLRWKTREGFISPAEFIPIAEESGKIVKIGLWVFETACKTLKEMNARYDRQICLSINISVVQLLQSDFVEEIRAIIEEVGINPEQIEVEITESVFISSKEYIISILNEIKKLGISIALDDFGTQYASLSYIQELPLDILKIDKLFIDRIISEDERSNLVKPIIDIANRLDYKVVAEGIEVQQQVDYLNEVGCDYIQGYLWGRPLETSDMIKLLDTILK